MKIQRRTIKPRSTRALLRDTSGAVALIVGLALPVLAGFGILGLDTGTWYFERRNMQTAADAGALASAWALNRGTATAADTALLTSVASTDAATNGYAAGADTLTTTYLGAYGGVSDAVRVSITKSPQLFLAPVLGVNAVSVNVTAVAGTVPPGNDACFIALDTSGSCGGSITIKGAASINADCGGMTACTAWDSIEFIGNGATLTSLPSLTTSGGIDQGSLSDAKLAGTTVKENSLVPDSANPYNNRESDLYPASWETAAASACSGGGASNQPDQRTVTVAANDPADAFQSLIQMAAKPADPGGGASVAVNTGLTDSTTGRPVYVWCANNGTVEWDTGVTVASDAVHIIYGGVTGGDFEMGDVTASNVSIIADNIAIDKTNGNSTSTLSAYGNSGADDYVWDKLLLYATYDAGIHEWTINGNADFLFDGRLYMPDYNYVVSGNMSQVGGCFGIIANRIKYDGSSGTDNASGQNCIDGGAAGAGISTIRLVE